MPRRALFVGLVLFCAPALTVSTASAQDYKLMRVASGLNQPNFLTQAPGDPSNVIYYTERAAPPTAGSGLGYQGFNIVNRMGRVGL